MDDPDYEDYLEKLGWFDYSAGPGYPRKGHTAEHVYIDAWQKLMRTIPRYHEYQVPNGALANILSVLPGYITQRRASICSRLACFLGCNCGRSIMDAASRLAARHKGDERAYTMAWAVENTRHHAVNHGVRTLEHVMSNERGVDREGMGYAKPATDLTADDYETAECFMRWLGSHDGLAFTAAAEREIKDLEAASIRAKQIGALPPELPSTVGEKP